MREIACMSGFLLTFFRENAAKMNTED
jgi:hypothetical protein